MVKHTEPPAIDVGHDWPNAPSDCLGSIKVESCAVRVNAVDIVAKLTTSTAFDCHGTLTMRVFLGQTIDPLVLAANGFLYKQRCSMDAFNYLSLARCTLAEAALPAVVELGGL